MMQPLPNPTGPVWPLVLEDMHGRDLMGLGTYGVRLTAFNGRDPLRDAYEEALDMAVYLRTAMVERDAWLARVEELERLAASLADRVHKQSELLSKRAERTDDTPPRPPGYVALAFLPGDDEPIGWRVTEGLGFARDWIDAVQGRTLVKIRFRLFEFGRELDVGEGAK